MGGYGSGRWGYHTKKRTTDDMHSLDVRKMQRTGCLQQGASFVWEWRRDGERVSAITVNAYAGALALTYCTGQGNALKSHLLNVALDWTPCTFGGRRPWFLCPSCGRRVAILYGGAAFLCRACHRLGYWTQGQRADSRLHYKAARIKARLGWREGLPPLWQKPKGMHWRTFQRLVHEMQDLEAQAEIAWMRRACAITGMHIPGITD
ncbi:MULTISPECIES: hypothetical protein [unclassified Desulfovibrio]|uniref:hypothetical protein n=1 Tax=unclassified Desulfovibrio TaxID=2593640 RepID=UPI000F5F7381|nr:MULTISPECIES: hypothetical protein [unclassified Desulfovibrio]RRD69505.1 hypothetical protein EII24_09905 [Desulfovibrio sp. OH1209_COT-279]RRD86184.1 hypothetical protein EII23_09905 [Desulfovibrio sp. OH1186_COT-070]